MCIYYNNYIGLHFLVTYLYHMFVMGYQESRTCTDTQHLECSTILIRSWGWVVIFNILKVVFPTRSQEAFPKITSSGVLMTGWSKLVSYHYGQNPAPIRCIEIWTSLNHFTAFNCIFPIFLWIGGKWQLVYHFLYQLPRFLATVPGGIPDTKWADRPCISFCHDSCTGTGRCGLAEKNSALKLPLYNFRILNPRFLFNFKEVLVVLWFV